MKYLSPVTTLKINTHLAFQAKYLNFTPIRKLIEGTSKSPCFLINMGDRLKEMEQIVTELIEGTDCFIVSTQSLPKNNFKFFIDSDTGFGIDQAISINRKLRNRIDESGWFPDGDYSLEVSSPGIDTPLTTTRQLVKNINRLVKVDFMDKDVKSAEGRLLAVDEDYIKISVKNKKEMIERELKRNDIKKIVVQIEF